MMNEAVRLENWCFSIAYAGSDEFKAPEQGAIPTLVGYCYGHKKKPDGSYIRTSPLRFIDGRNVRTQSGTLYWLGSVDEVYSHELKALGYEIDPDDPLKALKGKL